jgi:hypothetical protein
MRKQMGRLIGYRTHSNPWIDRAANTSSNRHPSATTSFHPTAHEQDKIMKQQKRAAAISWAWARNVINGGWIKPSVQNVNLMLNPASTNQIPREEEGENKHPRSIERSQIRSTIARSGDEHGRIAWEHRRIHWGSRCGTHLLAAEEGEYPAAASDAAALLPPSSPGPLPLVEAELRRGVALSEWSPCWLSGDAGGGGGGGGCGWPAKTTLLSNVDHFMVPAPHPPRRSPPDPADSPEFRRRRSPPPPWYSPPSNFFSPPYCSPTTVLRRLRSSPPTPIFVSLFSLTRLLSLLLPLCFLYCDRVFSVWSGRWLLASVKIFTFLAYKIYYKKNYVITSLTTTSPLWLLGAFYFIDLGFATCVWRTTMWWRWQPRVWWVWKLYHKTLRLVHWKEEIARQHGSFSFHGLCTHNLVSYCF